MSKEELNDDISNSHVDNTLAVGDLNTQQNVETNLIQEDDGKSSQSQNKIDHKTNSDLTDENRASNSISGDLNGVNKHDDSASSNEKSALDSEETTNLNNTNDTSQSIGDTEVNGGSSSVDRTLNEGADDPTVKQDIGVKSDQSCSNSATNSRSPSPVSQSKSEIENQDNKGTADSKSEISEGVADGEVDAEKVKQKDEIKRTSFSLDREPHFSRPEKLDDSEKENDIGQISEENPGVDKTVTNYTNDNQTTDNGEKQVVSDAHSDLKSDEDIVKEQELSGEVKSDSDRNDKTELSEISHEKSDEIKVDKTEKELSEEKSDSIQAENTEAGNYEDDFEETTEEDTLDKQKDKVNHDKEGDLEDTTSKPENDQENIVKSDASLKGDSNLTESDKVIENTEASEKITESNSNIDEKNTDENTNVDLSVNESKTKEDKDSSKSSDGNLDDEVVKTVNEADVEKELTEIVIDEDGIPKVAITTVPDRPPSSQAGDTVDQADPFEDFDLEAGDKGKDKSESKKNEDISQTKEEKTPENLMEEDKVQEKAEMENAQKEEDNKSDIRDTTGNEDVESISNEPSTASKDDKTNNESVNESKESENATENVTEKDKEEVQKPEEKPKSPEPVKPPQESPLEQMLKRNVKIDGTVESLPQLEANVTTLLNSMKEVMKYYSDLLKLQALKDFTNDLGKIKGDFTSVNDAFKFCNSMSTNVNQHLKELRHITDEVKSQIQRKFQQEDLNTWMDATPEKEEGKEKLQEEVYAAEKEALANAAEARQIVAKATAGISETNKLIAEMEAQTVEAQAISQKAEIQARTSIIAAEEARVAAEERRRAEEAAKARAEERARIKAAEDEKKKAMEEMKIHQEAAAKGTSVEDERKRFNEEKKRKEQEKKDPKNWPRFVFQTEGVDFKPAVGCIVRAIEGSMRKTDVTCSYVDQAEGILTLEASEELVSNIISIKQTEEDRTLTFDEPVSVALPISIGRVPTGKETVVKQRMSNGAWREIPSADVQFEDNRELKFVEGRCNKFGSFVVVLRPKKDTLQFQKKGCKLLCSSDFRISFSCKPGTVKQNVNGLLEVHTYDSNVVHDLKKRNPKECEDLLTASPFIKFSIPMKKFEKPLTVTLPLPQTQSRQKRPMTGITRETKPTQDIRPSTARPTATTEEDANEQIFFLHRDAKSGWTVNAKIELVQPKTKDIVIFDIPAAYERMLLLRTKAGKKESAVEKMATMLENLASQRNVKVIVRQRNDDVADVMVACTIDKRADKTLKYMEENAFTEGPNPSPDIVLQEGQQLYMKFRGNVECVSKNPSLSFIFNTNIRATREFKINEREEFAQKSLPSYRGFVQIFTKAQVPKPLPEGAAKNVQPEMVEAEVLLAELLVELPKPEAVPPKPLTTAPMHLKEGPLTNGVLRMIAGMIGKEWKEVGAQLNLKPMRIQAILRNHMNKNTAETRFDMLVTWAKRVPKSVDKVQILCSALNACGRADVAEDVRQRGQQYKQQRFMSARVSHLRQAFVKVAKTTAIFNHWKNFAKDLGVPEEKINEIDASGGSGQEKCYTSLETWKDDVGETATVTSLATYLKSAKQERLSRDLETMVAT